MLIFNSRKAGDKFFAIRKKYGWTQLQTATEAEISDRTYSELERGVADIRVSTMLKICSALHITPDEVYTTDRGQAALREEEILARLQASTPHVKETALQLLDTYLKSVGEQPETHL